MRQRETFAQAGRSEVLPRLERIEDDALVQSNSGGGATCQLLQKLCLVGDAEPDNDLIRAYHVAGFHASGALNR